MKRIKPPDIGDVVTLKDDRPWIGYITEKHGIHVVIQLFSGRDFLTRRDKVLVLSRAKGD